MSAVIVTASADCVVNYQAGYPFGPANGVLILYGNGVTFTKELATEARGKPRTDYARTYAVIPQDASEDRAVEIFLNAWRSGKQTCGGSFDDAGVGDLSDRTAVLYDVPEYRRLALVAWYGVNYPGVKVVFDG